MANKGYLVDTSKCIGCRGCVVACKQWNQLPAEKTSFKGTYQTIPDLTANNYTIISFHEYEEEGQVKWYFAKKQCMHCLDPVCLKVCPQKAIAITDTGAVVRDKEKCVGCQYCAAACPFHVPRYDKETDKETKCSLCAERTAEGDLPACVKACITGALQYGDRDELIAAANQRVSELKAEYPNANVYGDKQAGGTNIIYVLADKPEKYGFEEEPKVSIAINAWQNVIQPYFPWLIALTGAVSVFSFFSTRLLGVGKEEAHEGESING